MLSRKQSIIRKPKHTCVFVCNYKYTPTHVHYFSLVIRELFLKGNRWG